METLAELQAREEECGREWQWLVDALNSIARVRAQQGDAQAFRLMQQQAVAVGQRRVELRLQMANLETRHVDIVENRLEGPVPQAGIGSTAGGWSNSQT